MRVLSKLADIKPGDQLRVRGAKSADGSTITADEVVAGSFHNYSGLIASIDGSANAITLKDLASKKTVTVAITPNSDIHRIPLQMATMIAARMKAPPAAAPDTATAPRPGGAYGGQRAGADLSQMLARLPTETLGGLKVGDAVMIVATSPVADSTGIQCRHRTCRRRSDSYRRAHRGYDSLALGCRRWRAWI